MDIPVLLTKYMPGAEWSLSERADGTYNLDDLVMLKGDAKPTAEQLKDWEARYSVDMKKDQDMKDEESNMSSLVSEFVRMQALDDAAGMAKVKKQISESNEKLRQLGS